MKGLVATTLFSLLAVTYSKGKYNEHSCFGVILRVVSNEQVIIVIKTCGGGGGACNVIRFLDLNVTFSFIKIF